MSIAALFDHAQVIVSLGPGGVGKTTTAAALALKAAYSGRRTLVCTIDPARRLASSLGLDALGDEPRQVAPERFAQNGVPPSENLWAMMLDSKAALDKLVLAEAEDPARAAALKGNLMYQVLTGDMPGMHEYAAISRLYELANSGEWELIVLDTPPTSHALDFLDSPRRLISALESPAVRWLVKPYLQAGSLSLKLLGGARSLILRRVAKIVGMGLLERIAEFLALFQGVLEGIKRRTAAVNELLQAPWVKYLVVTAPVPASVNEARVLIKQLAQRELGASAIVLNRVHERQETMPGGSRTRLRQLLAEQEPMGAVPDASRSELLDELVDTYHRYQEMAKADERQLERLVTGLPERPLTATVPLMREDVYDLAGLVRIAEHL